MYYVVRRGDTLSAIAARLSVKVTVLGHINRLSNINRLHVGQVLLAPNGHGHAVAQPTSPITPVAGSNSIATSSVMFTQTRTFFQGSVPLNLSALSDLAPPKPSTPEKRVTKLGDLSMAFETPFKPGQELKGSATVSSGKHDPGGVSYGAYQLSSIKGTLHQFLAQYGTTYPELLKDTDYRDKKGKFAAAWKATAQKNGMSFYLAQHNFIKEASYDPAIRSIHHKTGIDLDKSSIAIRNAIWSIAVQHGGAAIIIEHAMAEVHGNMKVADDKLTVYQHNQASFADDRAYQKALLSAMYDVRSAYVTKIGQPNLVSRYDVERVAAMAEFNRYGTESNP